MDSEEPMLQLVGQGSFGTNSPPAGNNSQSARTGRWSADGTCIVHTVPENAIETIIVPEDLLEDDKKHSLTPYSRYQSSDPIYSSALYPHFTLGNPSTSLVLYAARDTPIQLRNALSLNEGIYATYPWVDPNTEAFIAPRSLVFTSDGAHFVAGAKAQFAVYDVNNPAEEAVRVRKTSKSRYAYKNYGPDPRSCSTRPNSIITAMDISTNEDILALGTNTRHVALYANHGLGDLITSFKLPSPDSGAPEVQRGITQVTWSPDGTFLFVAERQSDTIELYDVRQSCRRLSWLSGRQANVNFQMVFDIAPTMYGLEVWAGGTDGAVRMWSNPEQQEGELKYTQYCQVHDDPACGVLVHGSGSVIATLSTMNRHGHGPDSNCDSTTHESDSDASAAESSEWSESDASSMQLTSTSDTSQSSFSGEHLDSTLKLWSLT